MNVGFSPWRTAFLTLPLLLPLAGCGRTPAQPAKSAPAAEKPRVEGELARTTLSPEQVASLGVRSKTAVTRKVQQRLRLPGWVMVPQGSEVTVTAPLPGYVRAPAKGKVPLAGLAVTQGQELFLLEPVLAPVEEIQMTILKRGVENELAKAREGVDVAEAEMSRVTALHKQKLRGQQDLEQARARLKNAQEDAQSALDKLKLFGAAGNGKGSLPPLTLRAPQAGVVLSVPVSPGQYVTATAPLMTVADLTHLWLRVPVPEADLPRLDRRASAEVRLKQSDARPAVLVSPVALVPLVDLARHTADLIYQLPADAPQKGFLAKDQMVTADVPLGESRDETMVPYAAVVFDAHAGAWVYVDKTAGGAKTHIYERRRVELGPADGDDVAIRPACAPGERVVVAGAGVLFSREFHKPPSK